jgi:hypothetical protein
MIISATDWYITIGFDRQTAPWAVLVIDDRWDKVKYAVTLKLGEKCLDLQSVDDLWASMYPGAETFEQTLWRLPWMVHGLRDYSGITFCNFPKTEEEVSCLCDLARQSGGHVAATTRQLAILIDRLDDSDAEQRKDAFGSTWKLLDSVMHPTFARAMLSRGGYQVPKGVKFIPKQAPSADPEDHRQLVQTWLNHVRGMISPDLYNADSVARWSCHYPSQLLDDADFARKAICKILSDNESYGVWKWCEEEAGRDPVPPHALHRWLAAKAFQTTLGDSHDVPVTALVAICEGARNMTPAGENYFVESHLYDIAAIEPEISIQKRKINSLMALGCLQLQHGTYAEFAIALRDWLIHPEQFEDGKSRLRRVQVDSEDEHMYIRMLYSGPLPGGITEHAQRNPHHWGRVYHAWDLLERFAPHTSQRECELDLGFTCLW